MLDKMKAAVAAAVVIASLFLLGSVCADALAAPRPIMRPLLPPGHSAVWVPALANEATNLLAWSEDVSNAAWTKTNSTANSATTITFTAQNGLVSQSITTLADGSYTLSFKARAITGNTALAFLHTDSATGNSTALTVTATLTRYYVTVLAKTGGGAVVFGIQDQNAAGQGQIEITEWQVEASSLHSYRKTEARQVVSEYFGRALPLQLGSTSGADVNDPVWDQRGLVFDGVNDYAISDAEVSIKTVIVAFSPTSAITYQSAHTSLVITNTTGQIPAIWLGASTGSLTNEYLTVGTNGRSALCSEVDNIPGSPSTISAVDTGQDWKLYVNAIPRATTTTTYFALGTSRIGLGLGVFPSFGGTAQALLSYPRALNAPEVLRVHRWLKTQLAAGPGGITLARSQSPLDRLKREIWARLLPMPTIAWAMPSLEVIQ